MDQTGVSHDDDVEFVAPSNINYSRPTGMNFSATTSLDSPRSSKMMGDDGPKMGNIDLPFAMTEDDEDLKPRRNCW